MSAADHKELVARLRKAMPEYLRGVLSSDDVEGDLNEAADRIETDASTITRLTADNKALTAERDDIAGTLKYCEECWSDERGTMIDKIQFERARATAAEAKLAKMEAERNALATHLEARDALADRPKRFDRSDRLSAELAEARKGISDPDLLSMSEGVIRLHYEDLDAAQSAFDWLDAFLASKEAPQPEAKEDGKHD